MNDVREQERGDTVGRPWWRAGVALLVALGGTGCSLDSLLDSDKLPPNVSDPAITQTPEGARAAYRGTLVEFRGAFGGSGKFAEITGLLSDELLSRGSDPVDQRTMAVGAFIQELDDIYSGFQKVRGQAGQAIGLLTRYLPDQPPLASHLYALQGYAEIFLAELFCSGIPLSTVDFGGDFTYRSGSTTTQVLTHAVALFDTALALAGDSTRFVDVARVGRARALLGLGAFAEAAAAAAPVADGHQYDVSYSASAHSANFALAELGWTSTVPDQEGLNGLDWRTSGDPRTKTTPLDNDVYHPNKYTTDGSSPIVLASGVEARLIEAEAALRANDTGTWLAQLNTLRTDGTFETQPTADPTDDPAALDTLWHAGSGGYDSLAPLDDPGASLVDPAAADSARVDLLFRERAFWLFLTGHRQGDLRRLIRQYGRSQDDIYPVGPYPKSASSYGTNITAPIPPAESVNPLFTGCASRGA